MSDSRTDVLIVGGGLAGAALSLLLRRARPLSVTMLEAAPLPGPDVTPFTPSFDARATALAAGSLAILEQVGVLAPLLAEAADILEVHVSRAGRPGVARIRADEEGVPRLGAVTENRRLGRVLLNAVHADDGIRLLAPARTAAVRRVADGYCATLDSGERIHCRLLVVADGARSRTREEIGIGASHEDSGHDALVMNVTPAVHHGGRAFERFMAEGPLALLPMSDERAAVVWTGPRAFVDELAALPDDALLARLERAFGTRLGNFTHAGTRSRYPLVFTRSHAQAIPHAVVVGNAAHTISPVAAQGFNLTLRDLALLAEALKTAPDIGALPVLRAWAEAREHDQALMDRFSRALPGLFRVRFGPLAHARQLGLMAFDLLPGPRSAFARKAMGLANGL